MEGSLMTPKPDEMPGQANVAAEQQNRTTVEDRVYERIKTAIAKRYIGPGRQLVEETLAKQLGVSRTPVRAAIRRLVYEGFVEVVPHRGAFVIKPTIKEIDDTFAVRIQLERLAARLAAANATPADIDYLERLVREEASRFDRRNVDAYYRVNDAFHLKIAEMGSNKTLHRFVADVLSRVNIYLILFDPLVHLEFNPSIEEHHSIVDRLRHHDAEGAERAMCAHLESTLAGLELDKVPEQYPDDYLVV